jgi:hypothetical protein
LQRVAAAKSAGAQNAWEQQNATSKRRNAEKKAWVLLAAEDQLRLFLKVQLQRKLYLAVLMLLAVRLVLMSSRSSKNRSIKAQERLKRPGSSACS